MTSEMNRPTDDELEAMAVRLDRKTKNLIEVHVQMEDAAAMLRACKQADTWNAAIEAAASACISAIGGVTHCGTEPYEICAAHIRQLKKGPPMTDRALSPIRNDD